MSYSVHFIGHLMGRLQEMSDTVVGVSIPKDETPSLDHVMWADNAESDLTDQQFHEALLYAEQMSYQEERIKAYPQITEQLDMLYHLGYEGWHQAISEIKDRYPKP